MLQLETTYRDEPQIQNNDINLNKLLAAVKARKWIIISIMAICLGIAIAINIFLPKTWQATAQLNLIQKDPRLLSVQQVSPYDMPAVETPETQLALIDSDAMAVRAVEWLRQDAVSRGLPSNTVTITPEELWKAVDFVNPKDTGIIVVTAVAKNPETARLYCDAVCHAFVDLKQQMAQHDVQNSADALDVKLKQTTMQVQVANKRLDSFKRLHDVYDLPTQQKSSFDQLQLQTSIVLQAEQDVHSNQAKLNTLEADLHKASTAMKTTKAVRSDALVEKLQDQLSQLELQRADAALKYRPKYPGVLPVLDRQIQHLKEQINTAIQNTANGSAVSLTNQNATLAEYQQTKSALVFAQAKLNAAKQACNDLKTQSAHLANLDIQYQSLINDTQIASKEYADTLSSLTEARLARDKINGNVQIAQAASVGDKPYRPKPILNLAVAILLGMVLSSLVTLILEQTDSKVNDVDDIRRLTQANVIGFIPEFTKGELETVSASKRLPQVTDLYNYAYANLLTVLKRLPQQDPNLGTVLMVTSAVPGEGKSVTAAHLALTIARDGKRVILVDADMRRASQERLFNTNRSPGLAEVLSGQASLNDVIVSSDSPNMSVIHAGSLTGDTAELLLKPKLLQILDILRTEADLVILDTPACSVVADALFLADHSDCILHVVGLGKIDEAALSKCVAALKATNKYRACLITYTQEDKKSKEYRNYYYSPQPRAITARTPERPVLVNYGDDKKAK